MAKIKGYIQSASLRKSIICYIAVFAFLAAALSVLTSILCQRVSAGIQDSYPVTWEKYFLTNTEGERLGEGTYISKEAPPLSRGDEIALDLMDMIPVIAPPIYAAACLLLAAFLFYRNKLKRPLEELASASEKISNNDLDFRIQYESGDELGQLCASFEVMRCALADNFSEMWRQVEERKRLNAAFAHDLRTPLTVLKGYNEILQADENAEVAHTADRMSRHISRIEKYIESMSSLQRLEEAKPECRKLDTEELAAALEETAVLVAGRQEKEAAFENLVCDRFLSADPEFIMQVFNNLISNASRYAASKLRVRLTGSEELFCLEVSDDGPGFSQKSIERAAEPYFTEERNHAENFGLGLYICKILCEHHGGSLSFENIQGGCRVTASFKKISQ